MELNNDDKFDQLLSKTLENEKSFQLSTGFADRIVAMAEARLVKTESNRELWWLVPGIISMIGAVVFALTQVKFTASVGVFTFISGYWGLVVFGIVFILALHFIDKLLLKRHT